MTGQAACNVDMTKKAIIEGILNPGVIAIIRADDSSHLIDATVALVKGGIRAVEVTMTTPNALQVIHELAERFGEKIVIGVGTVLSENTARQAVDAGAHFVVTPVFRADVIQFCQQADKPVMSGSYTPTEAYTAFEAGSDFIKIFPADGLGAKYIKAIRAPLPQLKIIPTGGVDVKSSGEFIRAGCVAIAAGSTLLSKEILFKQDWKALSDLAAQFVFEVKNSLRA